MRAIAAISRNLGIGRDNDLLFHIPEDLAFFRAQTAGQTIIIGRKNLESFPGGRPLPNRRHLVLTTQKAYSAEGIECFHSVHELLLTLRNLPADCLWVCGGGIVYRELLPYCEEALVTIVDAAPEATVFFPDLAAEEGWELTKEGEWKVWEGLRYRFCTYTNRQPQPLPERDSER